MTILLHFILWDEKYLLFGRNNVYNESIKDNNFFYNKEKEND